jgi:hypothetical protein
MMTEHNVTIEATPHARSPPFGPVKVIKKTTGLYKSKRFHCQLLLPFSIAILSLIFGIHYFHNCPIQPRISLFLVVQGAVGIQLIVIHILTIVYILRITKFKYLFICIVAVLVFSISLFLFAWFIAGNVWIFSVTKQVQFTDQTKLNSYCNSTFFHFSFWLIIVQYIMGLYFCCVFIWIPQSTASPTTGIIKVRKQIPKIKKILKGKKFEPTTIHDTVETRL